jgi:hypothetical protein
MNQEDLGPPWDPGDKLLPPFEVGDIVHLIPQRGCSIDAFYCNKPLEIAMIERAAVDDAVVWDVELIGCHYFIIYCAEKIDDYDIIVTQHARDLVI